MTFSAFPVILHNSSQLRGPKLSLKKGKSCRSSNRNGELALQARTSALMEHYILCYQENDEDTRKL